MTRRASLPGADELFRATAGPLDRVAVDLDSRADGAAPATDADAGARSASTDTGAEDGARAGEHRPVVGARTRRRPGEKPVPSGRQRHDEKITVYVSAGELVDLEQARLTLRADHGVGVDRGRIVREALAVVLADLESKGDDSILVRRLQGR